MDGQSCGTCRFYDHGLCRRFPPVPVEPNTEVGGWWCVAPEVDRNDWCGEYVWDTQPAPSLEAPPEIVR
jgi:hypothetical protein